MASPDRTFLTESDTTSPGPLREAIDAASAVDTAPVTVLTDATVVPTDAAGRLDLVYTQPTTVQFADPYRTDLVLAIDGWNHVTWEGVAVHGVPDADRTVWASAMWRDIDSTWHLLVEQGSTGATGGLERVTAPQVDVVTSVAYNSQTGAYETDAEGYSIPTEEPNASGRMIQNADHVVRWTEPYDDSSVEHHVQPVRTGYVETQGLSYARTKGWDTAPTSDVFTDGVSLTCNIRVYGPEVHYTGDLLLAGATGITHREYNTILSMDTLIGHGNRISWNDIRSWSVSETATLSLVLNPDPGSPYPPGVTVYYVDNAADAPATGDPVVLPLNPDDPDGVWRFPFDAVVDRSGEPLVVSL